MCGTVRKSRVPVHRLADCFLAAALITGTSTAASAPHDPFGGRRSYSSSSMDCLVANDVLSVHFTAMQQRRRFGPGSDFTNHCQQLPAVGKTFLSIDLLDRAARTKPVALRVVEEAYPINGGRTTEKGTLAEVPPKIYRTGTAETSVEITHPGHYALLVTVGGKVTAAGGRLRIPFSVALPPPSRLGSWHKDIAAGLALTFFAVMSLIGYSVYRTNNPATRPGTAPPSAWQPERQERRV